MLLIVITADRGLCGSFNTNLIKGASSFAREHNAPGGLALGLIGRKGRDFFKRRGFAVQYEAGRHLLRAEVRRTRRASRARRWKRSRPARSSAVYLVYNEFKSGDGAEGRAGTAAADPAARADAEGRRRGRRSTISTSRAAGRIFGDLLPRHVEVQVYRALLESAAAEHAARMTAMDTAVATRRT